MCATFACSISDNQIGCRSVEGVKSLAEALKVNSALTAVKCVTHTPPS